MRVHIPSSFLTAVCLSVGTVSAVAQSPAFPTLLQGTPVMLQLDQTIDGGHARMGQRVAFAVSGDVKIGDRVVIPAGSSALGTVTQARRGWVARSGRVTVNIDAVRLPGGQVVPLSTTPDLEDNGSGTADDAIATSLTPLPSSNRMIPGHHKAAIIPEGTVVLAFIRRDTVIVQETASVSSR